MNINRSYISAQNTYTGNNPRYIVVHNTDNFSAGANALAHAKAQHNGNFSGMSAHYYVDDGDTAYQATEHKYGTWHVGKNYGGRMFGTVNNRNSIGVEMCVQKNYNYEKAFQNTAELVRQLMAQTGIPADRVLQHYDVCAKNCPSQIRAKGDWQRFKGLISGVQTSKPVQPAAEQPADWKATGTATCGGDSVRVRQSPGGTILLSLGKGNRFEVDGKTSGTWTHVKVQFVIGWMATQYVVPDKAAPAANPTAQPAAPATGSPIIRDGQIHCNNFCNAGLKVDGMRGSATIKGGVMVLQQAANMDYDAGLKVDGLPGSKTDAALRGHTVRIGGSQEMVRALQILLMLNGYDPKGVDGNFGAGCDAAVRRYQADHGLTVDGIAGYNTFKSLMA